MKKMTPQGVAHIIASNGESSQEPPAVKNSTLFAACFVAFSLNRVVATTWHVSPETLRDVDPAHQTRTITEAAQRIAAGDVVLIHSGTYRETIVVERSG